MERGKTSGLLRGLVMVLACSLAQVHERACGEPVLNIAAKQGGIVLSWPESTERYYVESTPWLPGEWRFLPEPAVEDDGLHQLTVKPASGEAFFRLRAPLLFSDVATGGTLYDNWWAVTGQPEPEGDHPLWASRPDQSTNARSGPATWRCKECHGWDYKGVDGAYGAGSHRTGIRGILGTTMTAPEIYELLDSGHSYGAAGLTGAELWNLVKFVLDGQIDSAAILDGDGKFIGDIGRGESLYANGIGENDSCATCHGPDGLSAPPGAADFHDYPGLIASENPWEFQHKVRFGQPGTRMLGSVAGGGTLQDVADLAAFVQTLPAAAPGASAALGGLLYDNWWAATGAPEPDSDHPLWQSRPDQASNTRTGAATWRCKECHGWDYKGVDGAYAAGNHRTGIAGIFNTRSNEEEIFATIREDHGYAAAGLSDRDIAHLVKFVLEGLIDTDAVIDGDGRFLGNPERGMQLYRNGVGTNPGCAQCHGENGLSQPPGSQGFDAYPGRIANENPWEFQHKVRFGQPGTGMPGTLAGGGTLQDAADLSAYSQTLPEIP